MLKIMGLFPYSFNNTKTFMVCNKQSIIYTGVTLIIIFGMQLANMNDCASRYKITDLLYSSLMNVHWILIFIVNYAKPGYFKRIIESLNKLSKYNKSKNDKIMRRYIILKGITLSIYFLLDFVIPLSFEINYNCTLAYYIQYFVKMSSEVAYIFVISKITNCMHSLKDKFKTNSVKNTGKCYKEIMSLKLLFFKNNQYYSLPLLMTFANYFIEMLYIFDMFTDLDSIETALNFILDKYDLIIWCIALTIESVSLIYVLESATETVSCQIDLSLSFVETDSDYLQSSNTLFVLKLIITVRPKIKNLENSLL